MARSANIHHSERCRGVKDEQDKAREPGGKGMRNLAQWAWCMLKRPRSAYLCVHSRIIFIKNLLKNYVHFAPY